MINPHPRIVYYGTPGFAVPALEALVAHGYAVVAVVTASDKPSGRGMKVQMPAVKEKALALGIPVLQPEVLTDPDFVSRLKELNADLQVVVAFRKLPAVVWQLPPLGTFNLHASMLPQYRGAAPINWVIINGERQTGLSTFFIDDKIDTGKVILQEVMPVEDDDDAGSLHDRMMLAGAALIIRTMTMIVKGNVTLTDQTIPGPGIMLKPAPKLNKENCRIDWSLPGSAIRNLVRGLSPYPVATAVLSDGTLMKIYKVDFFEATASREPGMIETDGRSFLRVFCGDGYVDVLELQAAGRKRMGVAEFVRGYQLEKETFFRVL